MRSQPNPNEQRLSLQIKRAAHEYREGRYYAELIDKKQVAMKDLTEVNQNRVHALKNGESYRIYAEALNKQFERPSPYLGAGASIDASITLE